MNKRRDIVKRRLLPGVHRFKARGKYFTYYRPDHSVGAVRLPDPFTQPKEHRAAWEQAVLGQAIAKPTIGEARTKRGSVNAVIAAWMASDHYKGLSKNTKRAYKSQIDFLREKIGNDASLDIGRQTIKALIQEKKDEGKTHNDLLRTIRAIVKHGIEEMDPPAFNADPTTGLHKAAPKSDGARPWTFDEIERWRTFFHIGTMARLAFELAYQYGMRRSDIVRIGPYNRKVGGLQRGRDGELRPADFKQAKTGGLLFGKITCADLIACIEALPADHFARLPVDLEGNPIGPYLRNDKTGKLFAVDTFGKRWREWANEAGLPIDFMVHGGRKTIVGDAYDAAVSPSDAMNVTGHSDEKVFRHYGEKRDREMAADRAAETIEAERQRRRVVQRGQNAA